jgi:hypothetical protein
MKKQPEKTLRYKTRPIRMDKRTWEAMRNRKLISGKSWNLFLVDLLKERKIKITK